MPMYSYQCSNCGRKEDQYRSVRNRNKTVRCDSCQKGLFKRSLAAEQVNSTEQEYAKPVLSDAMGVHPDQVQEHRRVHPNIPILDDGRVVCKSHAERKRIMKKLGYFDKDGY